MYFDVQTNALYAFYSIEDDKRFQFLNESTYVDLEVNPYNGNIIGNNLKTKDYKKLEDGTKIRGCRDKSVVLMQQLNEHVVFLMALFLV